MLLDNSTSYRSLPALDIRPKPRFRSTISALALATILGAGASVKAAPGDAPRRTPETIATGNQMFDCLIAARPRYAANTPYTHPETRMMVRCNAEINQWIAACQRAGATFDNCMLRAHTAALIVLRNPPGVEIPSR
jgi:hypothetical protein